MPGGEDAGSQPGFFDSNRARPQAGELWEGLVVVVEGDARHWGNKRTYPGLTVFCSTEKKKLKVPCRAGGGPLTYNAQENSLGLKRQWHVAAFEREEGQQQGPPGSSPRLTE